MLTLAHRLGRCALPLLLMMPASPAPGAVTASFRYPLSNFSGPVLSQWARLEIDHERREIYALNRYANDIRIFNEYGMEIFVFGEGFFSTSDIAVGDDGTIFVLTVRYREATIHVCNYRGEPISELALRNIPGEFSHFTPDRLLYRDRSLYLVDSERLIAVVVDATGSFKKGYDFKATLRGLSPQDEESQKKLEEIAMFGFEVDRHGNMLFTVPTLFSAFRSSPEGELTGFGTAGSGPGKFGIASGVAVDQAGYIYITDRLRCVVLIFDQDLGFQGEFGYRGDLPSNLIAPDDLAVDGAGNVYVAQAANRGVSVFRVVYTTNDIPG